MVTVTPPSDHEGLEPDLRAAADPPPGAAGLPAVCPFLAGGDGTWRSVEPTRSHVCAAVEPPAVLASGKQRQLCLVAGHVECATFRAARDLLRRPAHGDFEAGLWPRSSPRVVTYDAVRTGLGGGITTPQARAGGQVLLIGLIVVAFVMLVIARSAPGGPSGSGEASPSAGLAGGVGATASPASPASPAPAGPSASPQLTASPVAASSASPSAPARQTYTVKRGDTLSGIAVKFGVTVRALRKANGLARDAVIRRGQVLVIPAPAR